jgi:hypothetical protein
MLTIFAGEMHASPLEEGGWFNLPRTGGVAYAAQESWVQSGTIKVRRISLLVLAGFDTE